ncbi:glycosyltransferase [Limisphaera sp. VF-2]|jgi:GT2 family glycosyltransferase|uniref:glycosyltransferase n=1 Tax=Limisphaera sp. VF-2 TaxID=3400418 RepID=UPI0017708E2E
MTSAETRTGRVRLDGKFFRLGSDKFFVKGVAYAPMAPDAEGRPFPPSSTAARDLDLVRALGANVVRVYTPPPRWFLDLAAERGVYVWIDLLWPHHLCFLDTPELQQRARDEVRRAVEQCAGHPAVFAYCVGNEIPPDIVRWSGPERVSRFLDGLVAIVRALDPEVLCTYANYPPTEYLQVTGADFVAFNVYLHHRPAYRNYLARLQMLAGDRPVVISECGVDALREGLDRQAELLEWQIEEAFRCGLAGIVVFSLTDEWHRGGHPILDWAMGLTTRDRQPKPAFATVQRQFHRAPLFPLPRAPRVSVVVASYNGARTLPQCLASLQCLQYPDYEVILVDDGSTDETPAVAARFPGVRVIRHEQNLGLSAARNTGIAAATGEIIAFTDADCRADELWLHFLVQDLVQSRAVGIGGPNLLPPDDSPVAAAVMVSPGGPAPVLLTDRQAEHLPGCNMAFYKWALEAVGGFDPVFRKAGDDVDVCWRLLQAGYSLAYSPSALVWHYRRSTVRAYLRQQAGYGEAEALLMRKHPEYFNPWGGGRWRGRIYGAGAVGVWLGRPVIYHGIFGTGWFQTLYAAEPAGWLMLLTTLEFHLLVTLPLGLLGFTVPLLGWLALTSLTLSVAVCVLAAAQAPLSPAKRRWWSRPLVALLFALQPVVRGWARYRERMPWRLRAHRPVDSLEAVALRRGRFRLDRVDLWSEREVDRVAVLHAIMGELEQAGWSVRPDTGWSPYDFEAAAGPWAAVRVVSAIELYPGGRRRLCFRLRPVWSLGARAAFMLALLGGLTLANASGPARPLSWVWLVGLPGVAAVLLHRQCRRLQSMLAVFLDEFARRRDLVRLPWRSVPRRFRWFQPRKSAPGPLPAPSPPDSPFAIPGPGASSSSKAS